MRRFLASLIFYPLLFLRPVLFALSHWMMLGCFLGLMIFGGFYLFGHQGIRDQVWLLWACIGLPFGLFLLRMIYDMILLRLNPTGKVLLLSQ